MKILEREISPPKRNYLKIETSGLSRDLDSIISIGFALKSSEKIKFYYVESFKDERTLLEEVLPIIEGKEFITYSGKSFDLKFLKTKCQMYFSKDIDFNFIDLQEVTRAYNFIFKLPSHSNKVLLKNFVDSFDSSSEWTYQGIKIKSLFRKFIEGDEASIDRILDYSFESLKNLILLDDRIRNSLKSKLSFKILNDEFILESFELLGNTIELRGKTNYSEEYFASRGLYSLEIFNSKKDGEYYLDIKEYNKSFFFKMNTEDGLYDEDNKCFFILKKDLNLKLENKSDLKSPSKILILYYKDHIFENQKDLCEKILNLELNKDFEY
ncbi:Predicted exonuclease [Peptoniphilus harei]|uniref:ribonuclease H-like domain-containing protein n=1 Tax=Peptoniphilus harei TaxID=54005 RepID=UPI000F6F571A|nr:ribonuclease H-like domain-containing protein [Peptoniphilus harei]QQE47112.1 ribonuclease H-like domain-containing protein [Peptoniphilus harei]VEJ34540.1 Predicted exonuclease [Peptoniphilus harei]